MAKRKSRYVTKAQRAAAEAAASQDAASVGGGDAAPATPDADGTATRAGLAPLQDPIEVVGKAAATPAAAPAPRRAALRPLDLAGDAYAVLAEYERHSLAHEAGLPEQLDAPGLWRGVAYRVGRHRLASRFDEVVEILPLPTLTPIPGAQPWMLGVANVRGNLLPVVDLKQFLEGERTVLTEAQRVLVVRQPGGDVAVTIDQLYGQRSFLEEQATESGALGEGRYGHFVERAYAMGGYDWGVFSLDRLSRTPEFRQAAA